MYWTKLWWYSKNGKGIHRSYKFISLEEARDFGKRSYNSKVRAIICKGNHEEIERYEYTGG